MCDENIIGYAQNYTFFCFLCQHASSKKPYRRCLSLNLSKHYEIFGAALLRQMAGLKDTTTEDVLRFRPFLMVSQTCAMLRVPSYCLALGTPAISVGENLTVQKLSKL